MVTVCVVMVTTLTYAIPHLSYARMTTPIGLLIRLSLPLPTAYPWIRHLINPARPLDQLTRGLPRHPAV